MNEEPASTPIPAAEGGYSLAVPSGNEPQHPSRSGRAITDHTCAVTLPDGTACRVDYHRYGPRSHKFYFAAPVRDCIWFEKPLSGGVGVIEAKAQELAPGAFCQAQITEQKEMRRVTTPLGWRPEPDEKPRIEKKIAERLAGRYAVCVRFTSGQVMRIGPSYDDPERPTTELKEGTHSPATLYVGQTMQVYICCRFARRWVIPVFLADRVVVGGTTERRPTAKPKRGRQTRSTRGRKSAKPEASPEVTNEKRSASKSARAARSSRAKSALCRSVSGGEAVADPPAVAHADPSPATSKDLGEDQGGQRDDTDGPPREEEAAEATADAE